MRGIAGFGSTSGGGREPEDVPLILLQTKQLYVYSPGAYGRRVCLAGPSVPAPVRSLRVPLLVAHPCPAPESWPLCRFSRAGRLLKV
jgi:hypothetical protein